MQNVTRQFEEQNLRKKITDETILLPLLSFGEREDARAAVRKSVESWPSGASEPELRRAREIALKPFEDLERHRVERQRLERNVDQELSHVRTFLIKLWNDGELEEFADYSEVWRYADQIREDVRAELLEDLCGKHYIGDYRIKDRIEGIVDKFLSQ